MRFLPRLSLTELASHMAASNAVLSVDTGLAHLTAALSKPNITLYGATDPKLVGTYGKHQWHLNASKMAEISAEQVFAKIEALQESLF